MSLQLFTINQDVERGSTQVSHSSNKQEIDWSDLYTDIWVKSTQPLYTIEGAGLHFTPGVLHQGLDCGPFALDGKSCGLGQ